MDAIILAAGEASRLGLNNIQKCMLNFGSDVAIDLLIEKLPPVNEICVCLGNDFRAKLLEHYLLGKHPDINFRFVIQPEPIGTANGVYLCLANSGYDDVVISWSDIIPKNNLPVFDKSTIFTSDNFVMRFVSRYRVGDDGIHKTTDVGNIMGLFLIKNVMELLPLLEANQEKDFVDVLQISNKSFDRFDIDFYDFGTKESLEVASTDLSTSSHAVLTVTGDRIIKKYSEKDRNLFEVESTWYKCASKEVLPFIPKIHSISDLTIIMERLEADGINEISSERLAKDFLARVVYILDEYFHRAKYPASFDAIYREYIKKPLNRNEFVSRTVPGFSDNCLIINGVEYANPLYIMSRDHKMSKKICNLLCPTFFTFIHGDPTLQNIMQRNGNVWFIDPKAKFGNVWLFGDPKQDFAKVYYSLVGNYDGLNAGNYTLRVGKEFSYSITKHKFHTLGDWYLDYLNDKLHIDPSLIKLINSILFIRTVGYDWTKSVEQAMVSFLHGTVLFSEAMSEI